MLSTSGLKAFLKLAFPPCALRLGEIVDLQYGPTGLTVIPTFRCTAACKNCCFGSHRWVEGRIPQDQVLRYIREAADLDTIRLVVFTGGECFLLGDHLVEAVGLANELGLLTRCVTNGYWASDTRAADARLRPLVGAGLTDNNFSTGDNHTEFVPIENVLYGAAAGLRFGLTTAIMVELSGERRVTKETVLTHPLFDQLLTGRDEASLNIQESPWISMDDGHARVTYAQEQLTNRDNVKLKRGCESILSTIVATPQRELFACCGITSQQIPEVKLGSLDDRSMKAMYAEASNDLLKFWLAVDGPEKIVAWASLIDNSIEWEDRFSHQCDICQFMYQSTSVRTVIAQNYQSVVPDVLLKYSLVYPGI